MKRSAPSQSGICTPRVVFGLVVSFAGIGLALLSFAASNRTSDTVALSAEPQPEISIAQQTGATLPDVSFGQPVTDTPTDNMPGWSIIASPKAAGPQYLKAITCVSHSDCWAVGNYLSYDSEAYPNRTLIEHWDGSSWNIVDSPNQGTDNILYSVTCSSSSQCWAVGAFNIGSSAQTLIERWDGSSWTIVSSPSHGGYLNAVTCVSGTDCWAVGFYSTNRDYTFTEHWDGTSWTIVISPNVGTQPNQLNSVTCTSASQCWAVGYVGSTFFSSAQTLIEKWDGSTWTIVTSPNPSPYQNSLYGVTCTSASQCWAVGSSKNSNFVADQILITRWDGSSWTIVNAPNIGPGSNFLRSVSCVSETQCWSVGFYSDTTFLALTRLER